MLAAFRQRRKVLIACDWPGNVRELENVIERAVAICRNGMLDEPDFPAEECRVIPKLGGS
jgi:transcriptional regulator of acetoin/glycerol metabolism